jgi:stage V sporulation protein S
MDPTNSTNYAAIQEAGVKDLPINLPIHDDTEILKVSAHSRPSAVAGAIAAVIRNHGRADVQAIGAGATNQAVKAVAIARDYLQPNGIDIVVVPAFIDVVIADEERTAIRLVVEART